MSSPIKHTPHRRLSNLSLAVMLIAVSLLVTALGLNAGRLAYALPARVTSADCSSPTPVGGDLAPDPETYWYPECSPYLVTNNSGVFAGYTLTVRAGTVISFTGNFELKVEGTLIVEGTAAQPVQLTSAPGVAWQRLWFADSSADAVSDAAGNYQRGNLLRHVKIEHATQGIGCDSATPHLEDVTLTGGGMTCAGGDTGVWVKDNDLTGNVQISAGSVVDNALGWWATQTAMPTARSGLGVVAVNNKIYVIGGFNGGYLSTVEEYDPTTDTWTTRTAMPTARYGLGVATVNGKIYAIGGENGGSTVEEYNPATDTWTTRAAMPTARKLLGAAVVNGKLYAVGGANNNGDLSTVEEYDPATDTWTTRAAMPTARYGLGVATVNGKIYAIGGANILSTEEYDPATDIWTTRAAMLTGHFYLGAAAVNGKIYAVGGGTSTVDEYDPATNTWATRQNMSTGRSQLGVAASNGKIYAIGGSGLSTVEEFTPPTEQYGYHILQSVIHSGNLSLPNDSQILTSTVSGSITAGNGSSTRNTLAGSISLGGGLVQSNTVTGGSLSLGSGIVQSNIVISGGLSLVGNGTVQSNTVTGGSLSLGSGTVQSNTVTGGSLGLGSGTVQNNSVTGGGLNLSSGTVQSNTIRTSPGDGLTLGSGVVAQFNTVENCGGWGLTASGSTTLRHNRVVGCANGLNISTGTAAYNLSADNIGVGLRVNGDAVVTTNTLTENGGNGLVIAAGSPLIQNNNFVLNRGLYDLVNNSASAITATLNYWNTTVDATIRQRIYDKRDDFSVGLVNYAPILTDSAPDAPTYHPVLTLAGPALGNVNTLLTFTATISGNLVLPLTYTWQATGQTPVTHTGSLFYTDAVTFTWSVGGTKTITVTAGNAAGAVQTSANISVLQPRWQVERIPGLTPEWETSFVWTSGVTDTYVMAQRVAPGSSDIYDAVVYHWNGIVWSAALTLPGYNAAGVYGTSAHDVYAGVYKCAASCSSYFSAILRSTDGGTTWVTQTLPAEVNGDWMAGIRGTPNNIYVAFGGYTIPPYMAQYNGTTWTTYAAPQGVNNSAILSDTEGYYTTCWGWTKWTGSAWQYSGNQFDFCDVRDSWGIRDGSGNLHLYTVGENNWANGVRVWKFNEGTQSFGSKSGYVFGDGSGSFAGNAWSIWGAAADDIYVAGMIGDYRTQLKSPASGRLYHYDGSSWQRITALGQFVSPETVYGSSAENVWATTADGNLLHYYPHAPLAPAGLTIIGSTAALPNTSYTFTATVTSDKATAPITYTVQATDQSPVTTAASMLYKAFSFTWTTSGTKTITVTAANAGGVVTSTTTINVVGTHLVVPDDYATIQAAIDAANPGDTIYVRAGTYNEHLSISKAITLTGENRATTILDGNGTGNGVYLNSTSGVIFSGFTIRNANWGIFLYATSNSVISDVVSTGHVIGINFEYSDYNTVSDSVFFSNSAIGVNNGDRSSDHNTFQNVESFSNVCGLAAYAGSNYTQILSSRIHDNTESGIAMGWSSSWNIESTSVYSNSQFGISIDTVSSGNITNTAIYSNPTGIAFRGLGSYNVTIANNRIHTNNHGIGFYAGGRSSTITANEIYSNSYGVYVELNSSYPSYGNTFYHNKLWYNTANAQVNQSDRSNAWDDGAQGNYWSDYTGVDANHDGIGDTPYVITSTTNVDRYPLIFTLNTYSLTVSKAGSGSGTINSDPTGINCGTDCAEDYALNTTVTLTAIAAAGSTFADWSGCYGASGNQCTVTMTSDRSITATFTLKTYTLTPIAGAGGSITPTIPQIVNYGASQLFAITADTDYHIEDVMVDGASVGVVSAYTFINVTANHTLTTAFAVNAPVVTPLTGVTISGSMIGMVNMAYTFTATINPITATQPITYVWQASGQSPVTHTGSPFCTDAVTFTWSVGGKKTITVTATNAGGVVTSTATINVRDTHLVVPDDYATIQAAIDAANPGDTIYVRAGTYNEHLSISKAITLTGENQATTIIDGSGSGDGIYLNANGAVIKSLTVQNANVGLRLYGATNNLIADVRSMSNTLQGMVFYNSADYNTVSNSIFTNNGQCGADAGDQGSDHNTFQNVESFSNGCGIAAYAGSNYTQILNSSFHHNTERGISMGWSSNWLIENCAVYSNPGWLGGILIDAATNGTLSNTVTFSNGNGIDLWWGAANNTLVNNRVYSNTEGVFIDAGAHNNTICNNEVYNNAKGVHIGQYYNPSTGNVLYHNNFTNTLNAVMDNASYANTWDNGAQGNYWSDYTGVDANHDGIGDTPYVITSTTNVDRYPLIFTLNTYSLTVSKADSGSGTISSDPTGIDCGTDCAEDYALNTTVTLTATADAGSTFASWTGCNSMNGNQCMVTMTGDKSITAAFTLNTYTLTPTAGANGSITPNTPQTVNYRASQIFAIAPNTGYHIADVGVDGASIGAVSAYTFTNVTANHTLTAAFAINTYTLAPTASTGGSITPNTPQTVNHSASQMFAIAPNTGYHIADVGVDGASIGAVSAYTFTTVTANHTLTAAFAINTYTLTPTAGAGGSITPGTPQTVNYGASQTFTITPNTGYHILDVRVDGASIGAVSAYTFTTVAANHTLTAAFAINTYTLTPTAGAGGSITPGTPQTVNHGASQMFAIAPNTGYHIADVGVDGASIGAVSAYTFTTVAANHTITAAFAINTYTLTPTAGANGSITPNTPQTVNHGASQMFAIAPNTGYHIADVGVDGASIGAVSAYTFTAVTANHTLTAAFAINTYTLTPTAGANGSITPNTPQTVNYGASQIFAIAHNTGYHILDVRVDGASIGAVSAYTFTTVTANHTITAAFAINTYTLTPTAGAGGSITPGTPQTVNHGASQMFTIAPNTGYHIADVGVDGASIGAVSAYTFTTITTNHTLTAAFAINTYTLTPTAGAGGSITPGTAQSVNYGASQMFAIAPNTGYHIADLGVDGASIGAVSAYTFTIVAANHTITATFAINTYTLTPTAGANGSITPNTPQAVNYGASQMFAIAPNTGYHIADVGVDGASIGAVSAYTFTTVAANHTITGAFAVNAPAVTPLISVTIAGLTTGVIDATYDFSVTASPVTATTPITYTWTPAPNSGQGTVNASYSWTTAGAKTLTVTAQNPVNTVTDTHGIVISVAPSAGDAFEPDDVCGLSSPISTDGLIQLHTFHQQADRDWITFSATAGITYSIEAQIPLASPADVVLELYNRCSGLPQTSQDYAFSPGVRLRFQAQTSGPIYLKFLNHSPAVYGPQVAYQLSVRALSATPEPGAVVIVAGRLNANDPVQRNIHNVTNNVYQLFATQGYTSSRIYYLATDPGLPGFGASATAEHLQAAITSWALDKVGPNQPFTLYMVDHGVYDRIYLDKLSNEWITPQQLDTWLTQLEAARPGVKINVMVEACYSGSFIDLPQRVGKPGRVVIASTGAWSLAWASDDGAIFSDQFVFALNQGESLYSSFQSARWAVQAAQPFQTPWLDDNGNGIPNDWADGQEAQQRGFNFAGTLADDNWPPYITEVITPVIVTQGQGVIRANVVDNDQVSRVWAVIYPPSYQPPAASEQIISEALPTIMLLNQGAGSYAAVYTGFGEIGVYRVVVYAEDNARVEARPVMVEVRTGWKVFLPLIIK